MTFLPDYSIIEGKQGGGRTAFVLHGILGSGRNWRTFARRLVQREPTARVVLVDLRNHGDSGGASGPHTLQSTSDDLARLGASIGRPQVVIGHSYGGKVAAAYLQRHPERLQRVWVLDSRLDAEPPSGDNEVARVISALREVPQPLQTREQLVEDLQGRGFSQALARWMTTNLRRADGGLVWAFDLRGVQEMIEDYWVSDLEGVLVEPSAPLDLVMAGKSDRWPPEVVERYRQRADPTVTFHTLPDAGHWVHVDDPEGLLSLIAPTLAP